MVENTDGAFVDDNDLDRNFRQRPNPSGSNSKMPLLVHSKSGESVASSPGLDTDDENTRLLNPTPIESRSSDANVGDDGEPEWFPEFEILPWWKRPSVGISDEVLRQANSDTDRYTGSCRLSSYSH